MEIKISPECKTDTHEIAQRLSEQALNLDARCRVKWVRDRAIRFTLHNINSDAPATSGQHDDLIAYVFEIDPQAIVRTARAIYNGHGDYLNQTEAI